MYLYIYMYICIKGSTKGQQAAAERQELRAGCLPPRLGAGRMPTVAATASDLSGTWQRGLLSVGPSKLKAQVLCRLPLPPRPSHPPHRSLISDESEARMWGSGP